MILFSDLAQELEDGCPDPKFIAAAKRLFPHLLANMESCQGCSEHCTCDTKEEVPQQPKMTLEAAIDYLTEFAVERGINIQIYGDGRLDFQPVENQEGE